MNRLGLSALCVTVAVLLSSSSALATPIELKAESAGFLKVPNSPGYARLFVDGHVFGPSGSGRGMYLLEVNELTGDVLGLRGYDTFADPMADNAMASYINSLPAGRIVLAAVMDEATNMMSSVGVNALLSLGASDFTPGFRGSWALIGVKGATPGSRPQASSSVSTVSVQSTLEIADPEIPVPPSRIPEPATLSLMLLGALALYARRRLMRQNS